jgi:hypothetical protein
MATSAGDDKNLAQRPSVLIRNGWTGAAFKLDRPGAIPADIRLGAWQATLRGGLPFLSVEVETSMKREEAEQKARQVAEKSLDLLAAGGGGAYRIATDDSTVYWWTDHGQVHASIHGRLHMPFPWSMTVRHLDKPEIQAGDAGAPARWRPGLRFFRMAQTARDPVSAFRDTYLAVENLLADLFPRRTEPKREAEKVWLRRALDSFNRCRPNVQDKDWLGHMGLGDFVDAVYNAVRHPIFHAKAGEKFHIPLDAESNAEVQRAIVPLIRLFLELAAEKLKWPLNERPQLEHDLVSTGRWLAPVEAWPFQDSPIAGEPKKTNRTLLRVVNSPSPASDGGTVEVEIPRELLQQVAHVDGWMALLNDRPLATEDLGLRLPVESLESLTLHVARSVRFGALVRTEFE